MNGKCGLEVTEGLKRSRCFKRDGECKEDCWVKLEPPPCAGLPKFDPFEYARLKAKEEGRDISNIDG